MKFLLRTGCGESLPVALRLMNEGNEVRFCMSEEAEETYHKIGEGMVEKSTLKDSFNWADIVVFDSNIFGLPNEAEQCRRYLPTVGSSKLSGLLENDRAFAVEVASRAGLKVPKFEEFSGPTSWGSAARYVRQRQKDARLVWKPNGEAPASTYVAESPNEMLGMLRYWEKLFDEHGEKPSFILTDKIEGPEISTEGWFNGKDFYLPNHTLERTKFFDGDRGEKTGCAGNVVWGIQNGLFEVLVEPFREILTGQYQGPFDINCIINEETNQPIFLEFTPRFGYDAMFALIQGLETDLGELFEEIANGRNVTAKIRRDFAGALRLHIPPYPEPPSEDDTNRPVGLPINMDGVKRDVFPVEVMCEDDKLWTSGPDGYVMVVGGNGATPKEAMESCYQTADKIRIPMVRYRLDLADKLQEVWGQIKATGWLGEEKKLFKRRA